MKKCILALGIGLILLSFSNLVWAQDSGAPDTLYAEVYPSDVVTAGFVRVPLYVTHDIVNPAVDSISAIVIPLCWHVTSPVTYCSTSEWWNNVALYPSPDRDRSIFRHLEGTSNWMMNLSEQEPGGGWDFRFLDLGDQVSEFMLTTVPTGNADRLFEGGSRVLWITITFRIRDSTSICIDTCFWPPSDRLVFANSVNETFIPIIWDDYLSTEEYCFPVLYGSRGDANGNGIIDMADVLYLLNYLFRHGPAPVPIDIADTNCNHDIDFGDVGVIINYLFKGGVRPQC